MARTKILVHRRGPLHVGAVIRACEASGAFRSN